MNPPLEPIARLATPSDEEPIRAALGSEIAQAIGRSAGVLIAQLPDGRIVAGAVIRESGPAGAVGAAGTSIDGVRVASGPDETLASAGLRELLLGAERLLRDRGVAEWVLTLEVTAHVPIRAAERLGYRPTGRGPYREIGPGVVEYLHGYTGPEGFLVDFARQR